MANATNDILADVLAAHNEVEQEPIAREEVGQEPKDLTPPETPEQKAERVRDEAGRFAKAEEGKRETLKLKEPKQPAEVEKPGSEGEPPQAPAADVPAGVAAKPGEEPIAPPADWKGAGKVQWNKLPKAIQAELNETYAGLATAREEAAKIEQTIAPHRDILVRDAGSVDNGINQLMQFYNAYLTNPLGLIHHIARTRGVDLGAPQGQQPQGGTPPGPDLNSLVSQAVQQAIAPIHQQFAQTESQQITQTISAFAADPRYPYFQDVKAHMGQLMKAGLAKDLPDAYDKAVRLNPAIWSALETQRTEEAKQAQTAEAEKARKAAAASLRGSPLPNPAPGTTGQNSTVHDDVRAAFAEAAGT